MAEIGAQQAEERDRVDHAARMARERQEHAAGLPEHAWMNDAQGDDPEAPRAEQARGHGPCEEREVPRPGPCAADHRRLATGRDEIEEPLGDARAPACIELGLERHAEQPTLLGDARDPLGQVRRQRAVVHVHETQPALAGVGREARRVVRHPVPVQ
jgi:hypothetical protein